MGVEMRRVLAFGASNSRNSINKSLATWAASQLQEVEVDLLDLNDFEMPIFSVDREAESGIPELAHQFKDALRLADSVLISFAEHNGSYSAAFKNIMDWTSRIEKSLWLEKPMYLLATSPGARGARTVLATATKDFPHRGGQVVASFSLPSFRQNFDEDEGITDPALLQQFEEQLALFHRALVGEEVG